MSDGSGVCSITVFPKTNVNLASSRGIGMMRRAVKANTIGRQSNDPCSWREGCYRLSIRNICLIQGDPSLTVSASSLLRSSYLVPKGNEMQAG